MIFMSYWYFGSRCFAILGKGADQEVKELRDKILNPETALFLFLLADVLYFINTCFCKGKI